MFEYDFDEKGNALWESYKKDVVDYYEEKKPSFQDLSAHISLLNCTYTKKFIEDYHNALMSYLRDNLKLDI